MGTENSANTMSRLHDYVLANPIDFIYHVGDIRYLFLYIYISICVLYDDRCMFASNIFGTLYAFLGTCCCVYKWVCVFVCINAYLCVLVGMFSCVYKCVCAIVCEEKRRVRCRSKFIF